MHRIVHEGQHTTIVAMDPPSHGGANHIYQVRANIGGSVVATISFQCGPILEHGFNGVQHDDLLRIVLDRLDGFQEGPFASAVNEVTAGHVAAAIASEETRTRRRFRRGVEGTSQK